MNRMIGTAISGACATLVRPLMVTCLGAALAGCGEGAVSAENFDGDPGKGADLVKTYACGSCHEIPGIASADGNVGPSLRRIATRTYIAGLLPNSPENMAFWVENPQKVLPGNAMPNAGISRDEARDIAKFLLTLR